MSYKKKFYLLVLIIISCLSLYFAFQYYQYKQVNNTIKKANKVNTKL